MQPKVTKRTAFMARRITRLAILLDIVRVSDPILALLFCCITACGGDLDEPTVPDEGAVLVVLRTERVEEEWADRIREPFGRFPGDPVTAAGYTDLVTYLPDDLLVKVDIASMANGLEVRSPFLDPAVVDLAFRIPGREKRSKSVLKSAFADLLPPSILNRKKMGFGVPLARWLREDLRELMTDTLLGKAARERAVFRPEMVEILVREHLSGERDHRDRLWILLMFELWAERYL